MNFKVGDKVSYSSLGSGVVVALDNIDNAGISALLYVIQFVYDNITLKVPVDNEKLRGIVSESEMKYVIDILRGKNNSHCPIPIKWNKRCAFYSEQLNSGDIFKVAKLANTLYTPSSLNDNSNSSDIGFPKKKRKRTFNETIIAERCCKIIASEFAYIRNIDFDEAVDAIKDYLEKMENV